MCHVFCLGRVGDFGDAYEAGGRKTVGASRLSCVSYTSSFISLVHLFSHPFVYNTHTHTHTPWHISSLNATSQLQRAVTHLRTHPRTHTGACGTEGKVTDVCTRFTTVPTKRECMHRALFCEVRYIRLFAETGGMVLLVSSPSILRSRRHLSLVLLHIAVSIILSVKTNALIPRIFKGRTYIPTTTHDHN